MTEEVTEKVTKETTEKVTEEVTKKITKEITEEKDAIWTARTVETVADKMNITLAEGCKFMNIDIQDYRKAKQLVNRLQLASMG